VIRHVLWLPWLADCNPFTKSALLFEQQTEIFVCPEWVFATCMQAFEEDRNTGQSTVKV